MYICVFVVVNVNVSFSYGYFCPERPCLPDVYVIKQAYLTLFLRAVLGSVAAFVLKPVSQLLPLETLIK